MAAGVLGAEEEHRSLLQSMVEVARAIFAARASSVFLLDEEADELVFEAVSGEGAESLLGQRIPASTGVCRRGARDPRAGRARGRRQRPAFARDVAERHRDVP